MKISQMDINKGIASGQERAGRELDMSPTNPGEQFRKELDRALDGWPVDLSSRFVFLFVELATIASLSRQKYKHRSLTENDLRAFLGHCALFFNSFTHR